MPRSYHSSTQVRRPSTPPPHALAAIEGQSSTVTSGTNTNAPVTTQSPTRKFCSCFLFSILFYKVFKYL